MKMFCFLFLVLFALGLSAMEIDEIRIFKSKNKMEMLHNGNVIKHYHVMLGRGGKDKKIQRGDNLVPEGSYVVDYKNPNSQFHKALHLSYPNEDDQRRSAELGVDPGSDIMIHGYPNRPKPLFKFLEKTGLIKYVNWTAGCVALSDDEMDDIFESVVEMTPVKIYP